MIYLLLTYLFFGLITGLRSSYSAYQDPVFRDDKQSVIIFFIMTFVLWPLVVFINIVKYIDYRIEDKYMEWSKYKE